MKWVTRRTIRVNRTATAWLVRRFVDSQAEIVFVEPDRVAAIEAEGAVGFDAPGARYPHRNAEGRCSFKALVAEHRPDDTALRELGRIVHGADFADAVDLTPESAGLRAITRLPARREGRPRDRREGQLPNDALYAALGERLSAGGR